MRFAVDVVGPILLAMTVLSSGCELSCHVGGGQDEVVDTMAKTMSNDLGVEVTLQCPALELDKGVMCTAKTADGIVVPVEITMGADESSYHAAGWISGISVTKGVEHMLSNVHGIQGADVDCPSMLHLPRGTSAQCKARVDGVTIDVRVSARDDGTLYSEPIDGLVIGSAAEAAVAGVLDQKGIQARVTCPFKSKVSKRGSRFDCSAKDASGSILPVHYVITNENGGIRFAVGDALPEAPADAEPAPSAAGEPGSAPGSIH